MTDKFASFDLKRAPLASDRLSTYMHSWSVACKLQKCESRLAKFLLVERDAYNRMLGDDISQALADNDPAEAWRLGRMSQGSTSVPKRKSFKHDPPHLS